MATVGTLAVNVVANTGPARVSLLGLRNELGTLPSYLRGLTATLAPIGAGMGFHSLMEQARDFRREMTRSTSILDDVTAGQAARMEKTAQRVAFNSKFTAAEAAKGYFFLGQSGLNAEQSIAGLPITSKFAQAGIMDLARATELLLDSQSAMGLKVQDSTQNMQNMARVSDVLTKASMMSQGEIEQFAAALANGAAASARIAGHDLEQCVAVLTAFHEQGVKGEEAGTAYSIVMRDLQTKALENAAAFEAQGVAVFDAQGELRNMADIVSDLQNGLQGLSDAGKKQFILDLGITDKSVKNVQIMLGTADKIREYEAALRSSQGVTEEVASKQLPAFEQALHRSKVAAGNFATAVIDPGLEKFGRLVLGAQDALRGMHGETAQNTARVGAFAVALGGSILVLGNIAKTVMVVHGALRKLAIAQGIATALSGPAGWAILATSAIVAAGAVYAIDKAFEGLDEELTRNTSLTQQVAQSQQEAKESLKGVTESAAAQKEALDALMKKGQQLAEQLRTPAEVLEDSQAGAISWETYQRAVRNAVEEFRSLNEEKDRFENRDVAAVERGTREGMAAVAAGRREIERFHQLQEEARNTEREVQRIIDQAAGRAAGLAVPAAQAFNAAGQAAGNTAQRAAAELGRTSDAVDRLGRQAQALGPRLDLTNAVRPPAVNTLDPFRERVNALNEQVVAGRINWDEYDQAVRAAAAELRQPLELPTLTAPPAIEVPAPKLPEIPQPEAEYVITAQLNVDGTVASHAIETVEASAQRAAEAIKQTMQIPLQPSVPNVDPFRARINELDQQVAQGRISWDDYDAAVQRAASTLRSIKADLPELPRDALELKLPESRPSSTASQSTAEIDAKEERRRQTEMLEESTAEEKKQTSVLEALRGIATRNQAQPVIQVNQVTL